jgi:hypothetical protein
LEESERPVVVVQDGDIIVSVSDFYAVYYMATNQPQLILRRRTNTDDHQLLARAWNAANEKAPGDGFSRIILRLGSKVRECVAARRDGEQKCGRQAIDC